MLFNSYDFLFFFPIVCVLFFCLPHRFRWMWLLVASYYFYMSWNPWYIILIVASTVITYACGRLMQVGDGEGKNRKRMWLALSFAINLSILAFFKYFSFFVDNVEAFFSLWGLGITRPTMNVLLPVGISFYTFQALGYTVDVYRGDVPVEKSLGKYALFVSFFPQLVAGPIERSGNLLKQMHEKKRFAYDNMRRGLLLMAWGYFLKMVVADRAAILADTVFDNSGAYDGVQLLFAAFAFSVQIFGDFCGYTTIAIGAATIMGFRLTENFRQPYFALSIKDFWRRWHITLSAWFRDYLYIPLGGGRCSRPRRYLNVMITFLVSGLWHGAHWHFVAWGGLHGLFQVIGEISLPIRSRINALLGVNPESFSHLLFRRCATFALVLSGWIFFRCSSVGESVNFINRLIREFNPLSVFDGSLAGMGLNESEIVILFGSITIAFIGEWLRARMDFIGWLTRQGVVFRWTFYYLAIFAIIIFGVYGPNYAAIDFVYFQF